MRPPPPVLPRSICPYVVVAVALRLLAVGKRRYSGEGKKDLRIRRTGMGSQGTALKIILTGILVFLFKVLALQCYNAGNKHS